MDVHLYVYDLSKGLARMYSVPLTGVMIEAIYHTSIVLNGVEYYFGQGIQRAVPASTHHGQPMEIVKLGKTELPVDVVEEYVGSLGEIYTPESYDLFLHNCNNFTQDLAMFLVGKSIPEHIRNLPQTFLNTPLGQMLKPQIEMALRGVTQGTGLDARVPPVTAPAHPPAVAVPTKPIPKGIVRNVTNLNELETQLASASKSCAVIFFTSSTCPPCKMVYPTYEQLAEEASDKAVLIKCDVNAAYDVSVKYSIRATPTFMTFLKGEKVDEWSGANPGELQGNVRLLVQMAHPPHPHQQLKLPTFQRKIDKYVTYKNLPPLDKLVRKLGDYGTDTRLGSVIDFIKTAHAERGRAPADVPIPRDIDQFFGEYVRSTISSLPRENCFALVDLVRVLFIDPRVSGYFAEREQPSHRTLLSIFSKSRSDSDEECPECPYNLRLVTLHLACNLFTTGLYADQISSNPALRETCLHLATSSLLDPGDHPNLRTAAASFTYNLAAYNHNARFEREAATQTQTYTQTHTQNSDKKEDPLPEESQVELTASLIEAISREETSPEALHGLLLALGLLVYGAPMDGAVVDLCRVMGVKEIVVGKGKVDVFRGEGTEGVKVKGLVEEVGGELLGRGL